MEISIFLQSQLIGKHCACVLKGASICLATSSRPKNTYAMTALNSGVYQPSAEARANGLKITYNQIERETSSVYGRGRGVSSNFSRLACTFKHLGVT